MITLLGCARDHHRRRVTILERGITSTRWRDYVDIVNSDRRGIDDDELLPLGQGSHTIPRRHSRIVAPHLAGYGAVAQAKWATNTGAASCWKTLETSPCRGGETWICWTQTSFGDDQRSRQRLRH